MLTIKLHQPTKIFKTFLKNKGRRFEKDVPTDNSKMPEVAIAGEHRFDIIAFTIIDGIRKEFIVMQHFGEIRSKARKGLK